MLCQTGGDCADDTLEKRCLDGHGCCIGTMVPGEDACVLGVGKAIHRVWDAVYPNLPATGEGSKDELKITSVCHYSVGVLTNREATRPV